MRGVRRRGGGGEGCLHRLTHGRLTLRQRRIRYRGDLIPGTGGVRKLRWGVEGRGKRGGARIIYYFHSDRMPLYLLAVFTKNERADLSPSERATLRSLVDQLVAAWNL